MTKYIIFNGKIRADQHESLRALAYHRHVPMARLYREAIDFFLSSHSQELRELTQTIRSITPEGSETIRERPQLTEALNAFCHCGNPKENPHAEACAYCSY